LAEKWKMKKMDTYTPQSPPFETDIPNKQLFYALNQVTSIFRNWWCQENTNAISSKTPLLRFSPKIRIKTLLLVILTNLLRNIWKPSFTNLTKDTYKRIIASTRSFICKWYMLI